MEELNEKIEQLQAMLEANISKMNKIVSEEHQKTFKEVEILNESAKRLNASINDFEAKITQLDEVISDFSPSVEVKHYSIDVKKPLTWILSSAGIILISFLVCFLFYQSNQEAKRERDYYKAVSTLREDNYFKYKYMKQFGNRDLTNYLTRFDVDFETNRSTWIEKVIEREKQLDAAARASKEAELKSQEARQAQRKLDSINQKIR